MKRYFYNVHTMTDIIDAIEYNRSHDDHKQVNICPVFEVTENTDLENRFDIDLVSTRYGDYHFSTKEEAQAAMNDRIAQCFEDY